MTYLTEGSESPSTTSMTVAKSCGGTYTDYFYDDLHYRKTEGSDTPSFYKKIRRGDLLPINSYSQFEIDAKYSGENEYYRVEADLSHCTRSFPKLRSDKLSEFTNGTLFLFSESDLIEYLNDAKIDSVVTRAGAALVAAKHDTLTFLAELREAIKLFRGALKRLIRMLVKTNSKDWARLWLEGRYGWRPLFYDMLSINEALAHLEKNNSSVWTGKAFASEKVVIDDVYSFTWLRSTITTTVNTVVDISYRGYAAGRAKPPSFGGELPVTIWELMPFSFVIDWFLDIGSKLMWFSGRSLDKDIVTGYGARVDVTKNISITSSIAPALTDPFTFNLTKYNVTGTVSGSLSVRSARIPSIFPSFDLNIDVFKLNDLIALMKALGR